MTPIGLLLYLLCIAAGLVPILLVAIAAYAGFMFTGLVVEGVTRPTKEDIDGHS